MATHNVEAVIKIPALSKANSSFTITADGKKLGKLKISKGAIEYIPNGHSVNTVKLNWSEFNDLMRKQIE